MEKTYLKINIIKSDLVAQVTPPEFDNVIFAESCDELHTVSQIVLSGKYNKTYHVLAYFVTLNDETVLIDGDRLFICTYSEIAIIDLSLDKVVKVINCDAFQLFGIYKFKSGYFVHGEMYNMFFNKSLDCVWKCGAVDIFVNPKVKSELEVHDNYITVYDWTGCCHYYNETGEFGIEYHSEYDISKK
ncbi:MAG: hypothetical protein K2M47_07115 [Clostridiales bacterium]|nr:hypothetical protein [Clostridiales bacterium]